MSPSRLLLPVFLLVSMVLAGCSDSDNGSSDARELIDQPTGSLEIIHASQDAPPVDVYIGGNLIYSDLGFKAARTSEFRTGDYEVEVEGVVPGGNVTVIPASGAPAPRVSVAEDERVTVVAAGDVANIGPIVLRDTPPAVGDDEVRVRVLHAASNAPAVDVYITAPADPLDAPTGTFSFGEQLTADALTVPAGEYRIRVAVPGNPPQVVYDSGTIDLPGGADLLVAAVTNTGTGNAPISLIASTDEAVLEFLDSGTPSDVRVVHASADAPPVDVVAADDFANPAIANLAFTEATDYLSLPPGTLNVKVVPTGATTPVVIDADLMLAQGTAYSVYAADALASIQPLVLVDDLRRIATEARLRLVHTSPSAGDVDIYVVAGGTGGNLDDVDPAFAGVPFLADTGYVPLAPGQYDVVITGAGSKVPALGPVTLTLDGGGIYTAAAVDQPNGGVPPQLIQLDGLAP